MDDNDNTTCICRGSGWVCESHPAVPMDSCECGGAPMPCECNEDAALPPGSRCRACVD